MTYCIYVGTIMPETNKNNKTLVNLKIIDSLKENFKKIGFFRPFLDSKKDSIIDDIKDKYNISPTSGILKKEAYRLISLGKDEEIYYKSIKIFRQMSKVYDVILVDGISIDKHNPDIDIEISLKLSKHLGCAFLPVFFIDKISELKCLDSSMLLTKRRLTKERIPIFGLMVKNNMSSSLQFNNLLSNLEQKESMPIFNISNLDKMENIEKFITNIISLKIRTIKTPLMFLYSLAEKAEQEKKHIVLPEGSDTRILKAAEIIISKNICDITVLDSDNKVEKIANLHGIDISGINIINIKKSKLINSFVDEYIKLRSHKGVTKEEAYEKMLNDVAYFGTMMVHKNIVDGMVSGAINSTANTIRPAFEIIKTSKNTKIVSSIFFMCFEDSVLVYGDCAVNPNPTPEQLADIAISSANTAKMFDIEPNLAMLSYSTGTSGYGADVDSIKMAVDIIKSKYPDFTIEGPIQYDAAANISIAKLKIPQSRTAGRANVFIFPNLNTGNIAYKAVQQSSGALAVGPILQGLNKPINDLSRGCSVEDIINTVAITAIQSQFIKKIKES